MRAAAIALLLFAGVPAASAVADDPAPAAYPPDSIGGRMMAHITTLAADDMEGRRAGSPGEGRATAYIIGQLTALGVQPGAADGGWRQPVTLIDRTPVKTEMIWHTRHGSLAVKPELAIALGNAPKAKLKSARVLFGGYGHQVDQLDVAGQVVILLADRPPDGVNPVSIADIRQSLARRGAAGVVLIAPFTPAWPAIYNMNRGPRDALANDPVVPFSVIVAREAIDAMAKMAGTSLDALVAEAGKGGFMPHPLPVTLAAKTRTAFLTLTGHNVIGRIAGKGAPGLGAVVLMAHHDHLGLCAPATEKDRICNGAVDNASGVAMLIEVARMLKSGPPPDRDVYVITTTAEEMGLLGARAYVASLKDPGSTIAAVINMDTVAIAPAGKPVSTIGRKLTPLDPIIDQVTRAMGREVDKGTSNNDLVRRQDGWAFMQRDVPAVLVGGAFDDRKLLDRFFETIYHQPNDDTLHPIELGGAIEDARLIAALARAFADPARLPPKKPAMP